jgi:hypothetical protein
LHQRLVFKSQCPELHRAVLRRINAECTDTTVVVSLDPQSQQIKHASQQWCGVRTVNQAHVLFICMTKYVWLLALRAPAVDAFIQTAKVAAPAVMPSPNQKEC